MTAKEIAELRKQAAATDTLTPVVWVLWEIAIQLATFSELYNRWKCLEYGVDEEDLKKWKSAESCGAATARP
jgi:hypothetical protein